jgi:alanine racemase
MTATRSDPASRGHAARLTIDRAAIVANWRALQARAGTEAAGVLKADAYGCGLDEAGRALGKAGCRTFFVAHLSEGERLRAALPEAVIYVLNGLPPGLVPALRAAELRPVLGSAEEVADWSDLGPYALHVDTGLNRLGLALSDLGNGPPLRPALLLSHFVASEEPDEAINGAQAERFAAARARFPETPASLCNSSGIYLDGLGDLGLDLVRPGYALYGGNPTPWTANPMRLAVRLEATILQVRDVPAGASVGYNATWAAPASRRIATVSIGYADGWSRAASNPSPAGSPGGYALVEGAACPIVGRVSMDLVAIDVTDAPAARRGALATFIGDALDFETVAATRATNGYEVLTSLGRRYARCYTGG